MPQLVRNAVRDRISGDYEFQYHGRFGFAKTETESTFSVCISLPKYFKIQ